MATKSVNAAVQKVLQASSSEEKIRLFASMDQPLKKAVRAELKRMETEEGEKPESSVKEGKKKAEESEDDLGDIDWGKIGGGVKVKTPEVEKTKVVVTEKELDELWASIEADDTSEFDIDTASAFDYQGFNAQMVMTQVISRGKRAGLDRSGILKDISLMCALSHKKGSINDKNYPKMKKSGQAEYDRLAGVYQLMKGGARGAPPESVTISRIGPTFSARIIRLILDGKLGPKSFIGPMKSSSLHSTMQTQYFVSVLPLDLPNKTLEFLVALCRAYSTDQTIALAQGKKPSTEETWERQLAFIELTRTSDHPGEEARKSMMKKIPWPEVYDKTATCVAAIKKVDNSFVVPSRSDFLADIAKV